MRQVARAPSLLLKNRAIGGADSIGWWRDRSTSNFKKIGGRLVARKGRKEKEEAIAYSNSGINGIVEIAHIGLVT